MPNDLDLRASKLVWYLRLCQFIGASIVLGLTAPAIVSWHGVQCSAPGQLIYNVVCAAITLPPVLYLIVSTGPAHKWPLPWSRMFQFFIDISFLSLWIAAISDSTYNCSELCGTCGGSSDGAQGAGFSFSVIYPALTCACSGGTGLHPHGAGIVGEKGPNVAAKQAFDSIMMILFLVTDVISFHIAYRRGGRGATCSTSASAANPAASVDPASHTARAGKAEDAGNEKAGGVA